MILTSNCFVYADGKSINALLASLSRSLISRKLLSFLKRFNCLIFYIFSFFFFSISILYSWSSGSIKFWTLTGFTLYSSKLALGHLTSQSIGEIDLYYTRFSLNYPTTICYANSLSFTGFDFDHILSTGSSSSRSWLPSSSLCGMKYILIKALAYCIAIIIIIKYNH